MGTAAATTRVPEQARALGDPTRYAVFEHLRRASRGLTVAELTTAFPLHPNAIRLHLARLREAGLVVEETVPRAARGRGRPALRYRLSPGAIERWDDTGPHEELSHMLLDLVLTDRSAREVGAETGARLLARLSGAADGSGGPPGATGSGAVGARGAAGESGDSPGATGSGAGGAQTLEALIGVAERLGFEPEAVPARRGGELPDVVLRHCPFAAGADRAPQVVCELHHGIAEGVCAASGSGVRVVALQLRDPREARCRLVLGGPAGDDSPGR